MPTPVESILSATCRAEQKTVEAQLLLPEPIAGFCELPDDPCEPITP